MEIERLEDPITTLHAKIRFLLDLKAMGEEPHEIEYLVTEAGDLLTRQFVSWLERNRIDYPAEMARLVSDGLMRYLFLRPGRRASSPLDCGKTMRDRFAKEIAHEFDRLPGAGMFIKEGLRQFVKFRATLVGC